MPTLPPANLVVEPIVPGLCSTVFITWDQPADADDRRDIVGGGTYSAGIKVVSVIPGKAYRFIKGANDTSLVNGTETWNASIYFRAQGATVTLNGAGAVTAVITTMIAQTYRVWRNGVIFYEMPATEHQDQQPIVDTELSANILYTYRVDSIDTSGGIASSPPAVATECAPIGFARQFGGPGFAQLNGLTVDSEGNIFTGGVFTATIDFGQGPVNTGGNRYALFVAKFSPAGLCLWSRRFTVTGTIATPIIQGIAVGGDGNIFLTGHFTGTANFGGSDLVQFGIRRNGFLVKLNGYGDHVWSKRFKNIDSTPDATWGCQPISVKVDSGGAVVIAGTLGTETTFNDTQTTIGEAFSGLHTFIVKFTADGAWVWERTFDCGADIYIKAMVLDSEDNIVAVGSFTGSANFGGGDIVSLGFADMYVAKLNSAGAHLWSRGGGGFASEEATAVALDSNDDIYVGGFFFAPPGLPANFGGSDLLSPVGLSVWLAKYDSDGEHVWSQTFADQPLGYDDVIAMAVDSNDDLIVCGNYRSAGSFGGVRLPFYGAQDCWVAKYDPAGENQWTYGIHYDGGVFIQSQESMFAIAVDPEDNIIGTLQSDAPSLTIANRTFANSSTSNDGYLFKHGPTP